MSYEIDNMTTETDWTENGPVKIYNFFFIFKSKEEYLSQTAAWKAEYKEISQRIRERKLWRKPSKLPENETSWNNYSKLHGLQEQARLMLQMRKQAKVEAGRQSAKNLRAA